jgi:hypothetical protein
MLQYGLAEDTMRSGKPDVSPNELYSQSAIYVAAAHALKPNYSVSIKISVGLLLSSIICLDALFFPPRNSIADSVPFCLTGLSQCFAISPLNGTIHLFYL